MLGLGPLAFLEPWSLAALLLLPALWWLLRVTPPAPRLVRFPAVRHLLGLTETEESAADTPPWLIVLRLLLVALVIGALAHPLINPERGLAGRGPLLLVIDNGWSAAHRWDARRETMENLLETAARDARPVVVLTTAPPADGSPIEPSRLLTATRAEELVRTIEPLPWPVDRAAALAALEGLDLGGPATVVWLSDGLRARGETDDAAALAERLDRLGTLRIVADGPDEAPHLLRPPATEGLRIAVPVERPGGAGPDTVWVRGVTESGRILARVPVAFKAGAVSAVAEIDLPVEVRNKLARLEIENEASAGGVVLLDERWRRRPVGLVSGDANRSGDSLLADTYYLDRALSPFSDVRQGTVREMLRDKRAVMILADTGPLPPDERRAVVEWMEEGGVLVRFAGPRLALGGDDLVPVALRVGGRGFGGAMSWTRPARLAPFDRESPFAGLAVPDDVVVNRQVLAEPSLDLAGRTWARLEDGTPLVTAERRGRGWLVLFHTTANTDWSNLSLSGLFVEMLRRVVALSQGVVGDGAPGTLGPYRALDGFGRLGDPPPRAQPIESREDAAEAVVGPTRPPGYYGTETFRRAVNLSTGLPALRPFGALPVRAERSTYGDRRQLDLKPWLLVAALLLLISDMIATMALRGLLPLGGGRRRAAGRAAAGAVVAILAATAVPPPTARAQDSSPEVDEALAIAATRDTRLAYVLTGDPAVDEISRAGLLGLGRALRRRTAVEPGLPFGADLEKDELAFYPLLYWPVTATQRPLSPRARRKVNDFLRTGGMIIFDTREAGSRTDGRRGLRRIAAGLEIPLLVPVPDDHVLTRSFYLLQEFPGRWNGGVVWVEQQDQRINDGVSSVIVGGNDWAAAWAIDEAGRPMFPVVPGGEAQREQAYRTGINMVMYALSGNYKADQVHLPAILERLGL